jgi:hypothetical protein
MSGFARYRVSLDDFALDPRIVEIMQAVEAGTLDEAGALATMIGEGFAPSSAKGLIELHALCRDICGEGGSVW